MKTLIADMQYKTMFLQSCILLKILSSNSESVYSIYSSSKTFDTQCNQGHLSLELFDWIKYFKLESAKGDGGRYK